MGKKSTPAREGPRDADGPAIDLKTLPRFRRRLLAWYAKAKRDLPWRDAPDAYAVWVSEIMLQQTQVATVVPYFRRFMQAFPSLARLAAADEDEVLALWEGLGYYRRARQLHAAAKRCVAHHDGRPPAEREQLLALPGVGRYTAGAILSIAHDQRQPILEANTFRLLTRLLGYRGDPRSAAGERLLWRTAEELLPPAGQGCGTFNQALMELGASVCLPRADCPHCPLAEFCRARAAGIQDQIPPPLARPAVEPRREAAIVVRAQRGVLLVRSEEGGRWAGLWDFPRLALPLVENPPQDEAAMVEAVRQRTGHRVTVGQRFATMRHGVTRYRITLECYHARSTHAPRRPPASARRVPVEELHDYPMNVTARRVARLLAGEGRAAAPIDASPKEGR